MWYPIKAGKTGNKPHKNQYRKVAYASFDNILENRGRRRSQWYLRWSWPSVKGKMPVMDKRIFKTFAEIADDIQHNITNKLQHRKRVRRV